MDGGKKCILNHIEALCGDNIQIDAYVPAPHNDSDALSVFSGVTVIPYVMRRSPLLLADLRYPYSVNRRFDSALKPGLSTKSYDAVLYEGDHMARYREDDLFEASQHIIVHHDIESEYRAELAASERDPIRKLLQQAEAFRFSRLERRTADLFKYHLFVSSSEQMRYPYSVQARYLPYSVRDPSTTVHGIPGGPMLYVGDLAVASNFEALCWFLKYSMPIILSANPAAVLQVAGRVSESQRRRILEAADSNSVHLLGYVDSLSDYYRSASLILAIVLHGAGVKIKTIDSLASGQVVVATSEAVRGTSFIPNEELYVGDTAEQLAQSCLSVLRNRSKGVSMAQRALDRLRSEYSLARTSATLRDIINDEQT